MSHHVSDEYHCFCGEPWTPADECAGGHPRSPQDIELASLRTEIARITAERDEAREAHALLNGCVESIKSNHSRSIAEQRRLKEESLSARAVVKAARGVDELMALLVRVSVKGARPIAGDEPDDAAFERVREIRGCLADALSAYDAAASAKGGA
jgi:hypothetical protein